MTSVRYFFSPLSRRLGTVTELPNEEQAWKRVDELGLKSYSQDRPRNPRITFGEVAAQRRAQMYILPAKD